MKRKIAIFGNGWSDEFVKMVLCGVREFLKTHCMDVFMFVDFSTSDIDAENVGEMNLVRLPHVEDFDGALILSNTFNARSALEYLCNEVRRSNLPAVSLELEMEGLDYLGTENFYGMHALTEHLIVEHGVKTILFIGGQRDNGESNTRCAAVRTAMEEHGLKLPDHNIIYGDFSDTRAQEVLEKWLETNEKLPDAIVCANDIMAMGICLWMERHGISVPGDVKVTGYDWIESARTCYPAITSVGRDWDKMGYEGMQHLLDRIEGRPVESGRELLSRFISAESCGCSSPELEMARSEDIRNTSYGRKRESMDFDIHSRSLYIKLREIQTADECPQMFSEFFAENRPYEGDDFAICLVDNFFDTIIDETPLPVRGYTDRADVVCCFKNGVSMPREFIDIRDIVPHYDETDEEGHVYIVTPLHSGDKCMGYAVFKDRDSLVENYRLYTWSKHMDQNLEQIRLNIRMEELNSRLFRLSVTDALTGIYNRLGYERYALPYLERCRQEGKNGVMVFADINRMKHINDKYGHLQGDNALRVVASTLRKVVPEDWIVVRYGGDEFLAAGECVSEEQIRNLTGRFNETLQEEVKAMGIPFKLTASVGAVFIDNNEGLSLEECFKKADESMYEMKKRNLPF